MCTHCSSSSIQSLTKVCVAVPAALAIASYAIQVRLCFFCKVFHRLGMRGTLGSRAGAVRTSPCRPSTLICCVRFAIFFIEFESTLCGRPGQSRTESRMCGRPGGLYRSASPGLLGCAAAVRTPLLSVPRARSKLDSAFRPKVVTMMLPCVDMAQSGRLERTARTL